jgi:hypothetical protein
MIMRSNGQIIGNELPIYIVSHAYVEEAPNAQEVQEQEAQVVWETQFPQAPETVSELLRGTGR